MSCHAVKQILNFEVAWTFLITCGNKSSPRNLKKLVNDLFCISSQHLTFPDNSLLCLAVKTNTGDSLIFWLAIWALVAELRHDVLESSERERERQDTTTVADCQNTQFYFFKWPLDLYKYLQNLLAYSSVIPDQSESFIVDLVADNRVPSFAFQLKPLSQVSSTRAAK